MREYLRKLCARELARTERVINVWATSPRLDVYMGVDPDGKPRLLQQVPPDPIRAQLKEFASRVILRREPKLEFKMKVQPDDVIQLRVVKESRERKPS